MEEAEGGSRRLVGFSVRDPPFVDQSSASPLVYSSPHDIADHENAGDCACAGFCHTTKEVMLDPSFEIGFGRVPNLSEKDLRHHAFVFVLQKMAVEERHATNDRIGEIHHQIYRAAG